MSIRLTLTLLLALAVPALAVPALAQNTTSLTATLIDSDGQAWNNCTWTADLTNPSGTQQPVYTSTGQPVPVHVSSQACSSSGVMTYAAMPDNNKITPVGTRWTFNLCSNTSAPCSPIPGILVTGASQDLSTILSSKLTAPRFQAQHGAHGYLDIEFLNPITGSFYFNVTAGASRTCTSGNGSVCSAWAQATGTNGQGNLVVSGTTLNSSSPGLVVIGDSIADGTGSASPTTSYPINAFPYQTHLKVGGPLVAHSALTRPGDQCEDMAWKVYSKITPVGGGLDPEYVFEGVTNDVTQYNVNAMQQQTFRRCIAGVYAYLTIPAANKVLAGFGTLAGGFAVDTSGNALQPNMGAVCTTLGCTDTISITTQIPNSPICFAYYVGPGTAGGTFTVKFNGVAQNDTFNGTTTWYGQGDGGTPITTQNGLNQTAVGACVPTTFATGTVVTVVFTGTSATGAANIVEPYWVGVAPRPSNATPDLVVVSANPRNDANANLVATYNAFISNTITAMPWASIHYANTNAAGLNIPTPITQSPSNSAPLSSTTYTAVAWVSDLGVTYGNAMGLPIGPAFTSVPLSPGPGQYSVSSGTYTFNSGDLGKLLFVSYVANCGQGSSTTYFANCAYDSLHPNNVMHAVMSSVIAAQIPAFKLQGITAPNSYQPLNPFAPYAVPNMSQWPNDNPNAIVPGVSSPLGYGRVIFDGTSGTFATSFINGLGIIHWYPAGLSNECWYAYVQTNPGITGPGKVPASTADCEAYRQGNGIWNFRYVNVSSGLTLIQPHPTVALPITAIAAGTCTQTSVSYGGSLTTGSTFAITFQTRPSTVAGYGPGQLTIGYPYTDGSFFYIDVCNPTGASITPGALTGNIRFIN